MKIIKLELPNEDLSYLSTYLQTNLIAVVDKILYVRAFYTPNSNLFFEIRKNDKIYYIWKYGVVNDYSESINDAITFENNIFFIKITDLLYSELFGV